MSIRTHHVQVHLFDGYWEDIGTIRSFYEANLALASPNPPFEFIDEGAPIYSRPRFLPPTRTESATIRRSLIADGCFIDSGAVIENSVIGLRCGIGKNVHIKNSVLMGTDYYQTDADRAFDRAKNRPSIGIGDGTTIDGAIIDKNCRIGCDVKIHRSIDIDTNCDLINDVVVRDGIIVVPKETILNDGWKLRPPALPS